MTKAEIPLAPAPSSKLCMPFIFSRRYIQSCLDRLRNALDPRGVSDLAQRLNTRSHGRLAAMWEAVVLARLCCLPAFAHESALKDGRRPDFHFVLPKTGTDIIGDITAVSDLGHHQANPVQHLMEDIARLASKHGGDATQFEVRVQGRDQGPYDKRKVILRLPHPSARQSFAKDTLEPYIRARLAQEDYGHSQELTDGDVHVTLKFRPRQQFVHYGHPSFTQILHVDRNPIWNALKAKEKQLRGVPPGAVRLLVLCDGGCNAFSQSGMGHGVSRDDVVRAYLRRTSGFDFVLCITVQDVRENAWQSRRMTAAALHASEKWQAATDDSVAITTELEVLCRDMLAAWPRPIANAASAVANCLTRDDGMGKWGGYEMSGERIKLPARSLQKVLAGEVSLGEFDAGHGFGESDHSRNPFERALADGKSISSVRLIPCEGDDDDWVEVTFAPDPALRPFQ